MKTCVDMKVFEEEVKKRLTKDLSEAVENMSIDMVPECVLEELTYMMFGEAFKNLVSVGLTVSEIHQGRGADLICYAYNQNSDVALNRFFVEEVLSLIKDSDEGHLNVIKRDLQVALTAVEEESSTRAS